MKTKLNKSEVFVRISSKKEAKQAKAVLKALGKYIPEYFNLSPELNNELLFNPKKEWVIGMRFKDEDKTEVTLKQLIEIIVEDGKEKTTRKFVMKSEDDVDLYEGDKFWHVHNSTDGWKLNTSLNFNRNAFTIKTNLGGRCLI